MLADMHEQLTRALEVAASVREAAAELDAILAPLALGTAGPKRIHKALRSDATNSRATAATNAPSAARREKPAPIQPALL
ncbi:MAG TPA: hypothetical protein PKY87_02230 [Terricaulis sp.]|nr:hypothetical protein [Terricaulis sp.]